SPTRRRSRWSGPRPTLGRRFSPARGHAASIACHRPSRAARNELSVESVTPSVAAVAESSADRPGAGPFVLDLFSLVLSSAAPFCAAPSTAAPSALAQAARDPC